MSATQLLVDPCQPHVAASPPGYQTQNGSPCICRKRGDQGPQYLFHVVGTAHVSFSGDEIHVNVCLFLPLAGSVVGILVARSAPMQQEHSADGNQFDVCLLLM
ncbi:hypothetical protein DL546_001683 [Coniochaeta pulveracea]|uniref:Uncharacterized protein n=1 Tax=Coniochaeta pulveracea TaxID=177199 RepID=A0A420Y9S6_9PEZI|nr:hypothetical protein DL546_001683 [Coniochaeta pulveracea]